MRMNLTGDANRAWRNAPGTAGLIKTAKMTELGNSELLLPFLTAHPD